MRVSLGQCIWALLHVARTRHVLLMAVRHGEFTSCSLYKLERVFDNKGMIEYRATDGVNRRVHKQYVDVVARTLADGTVIPVTVCWADGRSFYIDEILDCSGFGIDVFGCRTMEYSVRFGGHETKLYLESATDVAVRRDVSGSHEGRPDGADGGDRKMRWWVWAYDQTLES